MKKTGLTKTLRARAKHLAKTSGACMTCLLSFHITMAGAAYDNDFTKTTYSAQGDASAGATLFKRCRSCHHPVKVERSRALGPHLYKLFGRRSAGDSDYRQYSNALMNANLIWTEERLNALLENPNGLVPGIKATMQIQKIRSQQARNDLLAYLRKVTEPE